MPQIRTRTGRAAPAVIIDAALELFQQRGIAAVALGDIAELIGVTKPAIYHHFKTKDALVLTAFAPLLQEVETFVHGATRADTRVDDLITLALKHRELVLLGQPHTVDGLGQDVRRELDVAASTLIAALSPDATEESSTRAAMVLASICAVVGAPATTTRSIAELRRVAHLISAQTPPGADAL